MTGVATILSGVGDHVSFPIPFFDPLLLIAQAAVVSRRLTFGTGVYLLPLRHPAPVAKQVSTLDHLTEGRLIFGVGVGGEFPKEYELCGVPRSERGARLGEGIDILRKLWSGDPVSHSGKFYNFTDIPMNPPGGSRVVHRSGAGGGPMPRCAVPGNRRMAGCHMLSRRTCMPNPWRKFRNLRKRPTVRSTGTVRVICSSPGSMIHTKRRMTLRRKR